MTENKIHTINSLKYDGKIHRTWTAEFIGETAEMKSYKGIFEDDIKHAQLGVIRRGTISYEFFWKHKWYNVFRFHEPAGALRNFYCNVNQPPTFENETLSFVDLDVDVLVSPNFTVEILDLDEFEDNAAKYSYPNEVRAEIGKSLDEILRLIENREFPFNYAA